MSKITTLPLVKNIWRYVRQQRILKTHHRVASFWSPIIDLYTNGEIPHYQLKQKKQLPTNKIIWQYWGQGIEQADLPEVVQLCFDSVDKYKGEYTVIRLTDDTIKEYLDLPDFVWEKRKNPAFKRVFFSDLLRLALLHTYGGIWLDATIFLSGPLSEFFTKQDYFMYQRDPLEKQKTYWENSCAYYWGWKEGFKVRVLSSIIFAQQRSVVISTLLDLMMHYWKTQDEIIDYFFFQILYNELINGVLSNKRCPIINDTLPHLIHTKLNDTACSFITFEEAIKLGDMHKMTYFSEEAMTRFRQLLTTL